MKLEFKPEWFPCRCPEKDDLKPLGPQHYDWCEAKEVADIATQRLTEMLEECEAAGMYRLVYVGEFKREDK